MGVVAKMNSPAKGFHPDAEPSRFDEGLGLVGLAAAFVVFLSLVTFSPNDASWSVSGAGIRTYNWIGHVGAVVSDVLFQALGLVAYVFPVFMGVGAWNVFRGHRLIPTRSQATGLVLLAVSLAGLFSLFPEIPFYRERVRPGGFVGFILERALVSGFNKVGTGIVLTVVFLLSLMFLTSFSPRRFLTSVLHAEALAIMWSQWRERFKRWFSWGAKPSPAVDDSLESSAQFRDLEAVEDSVAPEHAGAKPRKSWFKLGSGKVSLTEEEEKVRSEQAVSEALYADMRTNSGNFRGLDEGVVVPPSRGAKDSPARTTVDLTSSNENPVYSEASAGASPVSSDPESPAAVDTPGSNTRRFAREAIARAQQRAKGLAVPDEEPEKPAPPVEKSEPVPVEKAPSRTDPEIEKMVRSANIVRLDSRRPERPAPSIQPAFAAAPAARPSPLPFDSQGDYQLPPFEMLEPAPERLEQQDAELRERARVLAEKCREFNVTGSINHINPGPVVTTFEFKPDAGVKYSRVANLTDDLCLALKAESVRIDRLPGKSTVGIEVPNAKREVIYLREIIESEKYAHSPSCLTIALGKTIEGEPYVGDLMKMPHLLIAGSTGSGKSVMVNTLICSILLKASPAEVKMIMVDPKRLELGLYEGIPHLLTPIVTDPKRASNALKWAVTEMENRYKQLAGYGVRNIDQFNREICGATDLTRFGLDGPPQKLPYLVIVIDELADLMMVASSDVETSITRLAQMARAVGIHLVVATQRPSVDVITGLIKANFPARISFRVSSKVDSRTILDTNGAEGLLGQGDMLFLPPGTSRLVRVHGSYVGEAEINRITDHIKSQAQPRYDDSILMSDAEAEAAEAGMGDRDELYDEAMKIIVQMGKASTSVLQRRLRIGYGRAAAILDMMEAEGYVGPTEGSKPRIVKQAAYDYAEMLEGHALNGDDE